MVDTATLTAPPDSAEAGDPARRPVVTLLPGGHRRAEAGHPWIYSNEIAMDAAAKALPAGALVTLRRSDERPVGVAMFNPHTLLAARLLDRDAARPIGKRFFVRHLERALRLRERIYRAPYYRLIHAEADVLAGQKPGWFYDQRDNRAFIAALADGARVIDLYTYSGGFAVAAARAGAASVLGIDRSEPALALAESASRRNDIAERCTFRRAEGFAEAAALSASGDRFDIVIPDPPPLARSQRAVGPALRG